MHAAKSGLSPVVLVEVSNNMSSLQEIMSLLLNNLLFSHLKIHGVLISHSATSTVKTFVCQQSSWRAMNAQPLARSNLRQKAVSLSSMGQGCCMSQPSSIHA